jgi:hypothetical protein
MMVSSPAVAGEPGQTELMWFETLTGFREKEVDDVASQFLVEGEQITSTVNGRSMRHGRFETPTLGELRGRCAKRAGPSGPLRLREIVADVQQLHADPANAGAFFQVASQFNTLEMVSPSVTPEEGIDRYEADRTQGPACAVACGAGTIYRNYLVSLDGQIGQTAGRQIDCLADLMTALGVRIEMRNGYASPTAIQLDEIRERLGAMDESTRDEVMSRLRIGLQLDTEVTLGGRGHLVTQAYCSALPVAYMSHPSQAWEPFARLVLDAAYEASLCAGVLNADATGNRCVYLTLLGGGAFGNPTPWILDAIERVVSLFADAHLDVAIISFGSANPSLQSLL